ncbi:hypothetical protein JTE90_017095 [Oedothorax gibbosus]|uniref:Uncharacterized protein n=1 Tax=Oedothorax gibbosus TaxID=931172 RepID=A0AAV6UF32_9ARAC|nr:hypothetical protein JTE90_017095 [Oedothorax gibbosus]
MNFLYNAKRMRGETSIAKRPYTFRNPSIQHRFVAPANTFDKYTMRQGVMKTPVLGHASAFSPYENAYICRDEGYASAMEIEDPGMWDNECALDMEMDFDVEEDNCMKRKNNFAYPETEYFPQEKGMHPRMYMNKENQMNSAKMGREMTPKRQSVLCTDTPRGLGFKLQKKEKSLIEIEQENSPKLVSKSTTLDAPLKPKPKPQSQIPTFPRIFTVTVEKLQGWKKTLPSGQMVFELYGILEKVLDVKFPKCKKLQFRMNMKSSLICTFYEIDRTLPGEALGQWCRCIVLWRQNNEYQCVSIRSASANELKNLDKWMVASSKSMAVILKTLK